MQIMESVTKGRLLIWSSYGDFMRDLALLRERRTIASQMLDPRYDDVNNGVLTYSVSLSWIKFGENGD